MVTVRPYHRKGIAMIELIFALVIMGIVLMSAPMVISRAAQSNITAFQQESIAIAASHTNALMSYMWDNTNVLTANNSALLITAGDVNLNENLANLGTRGITAYNLANQRQRRFRGLAAGVIGQEGLPAPLDDVDDFNNTNIGLNLYTAAANLAHQGEYIDVNVNINTQVGYQNDVPAGNAYTVIPVGNLTYNFPQAINGSINSSNIKHIITTLTSASPDAEIADKTIVLHAFMCNIGAAKLLTRDNI